MPKSAEIHLPYFKQGDDLGHCLEKCKTIGESLEMQAECMDEAAKILRSIKELTDGHNVQIDADTHMIVISGSEDIINKLIEKELAFEMQDDEFDDDEDDDE